MIQSTSLIRCPKYVKKTDISQSFPSPGETRFATKVLLDVTTKNNIIKTIKNAL